MGYNKLSLNWPNYNKFKRENHANELVNWSIGRHAPTYMDWQIRRGPSIIFAKHLLSYFAKLSHFIKFKLWKEEKNLFILASFWKTNQKNYWGAKCVCRPAAAARLSPAGWCQASQTCCDSHTSIILTQSPIQTSRRLQDNSIIFLGAVVSVVNLSIFVSVSSGSSALCLFDNCLSNLHSAVGTFSGCSFIPQLLEKNIRV